MKFMSFITNFSDSAQNLYVTTSQGGLIKTMIVMQSVYIF